MDHNWGDVFLSYFFINALKEGKAMEGLRGQMGQHCRITLQGNAGPVIFGTKAAVAKSEDFCTSRLFPKGCFLVLFNHGGQKELLRLSQAGETHLRPPRFKAASTTRGRRTHLRGRQASPLRVSFWALADFVELQANQRRSRRIASIPLFSRVLTLSKDRRIAQTNRDISQQCCHVLMIWQCF